MKHQFWFYLLPFFLLNIALTAQSVKEKNFGTAVDDRFCAGLVCSTGEIIALGAKQSINDDTELAYLQKMDNQGKQIKERSFSVGIYNYPFFLAEDCAHNFIAIGNSSEEKIDKSHQYNQKYKGWVKIFTSDLEEKIAVELRNGQYIAAADISKKEGANLQLLVIENGLFFLKKINRDGKEIHSINLSTETHIQSVKSARMCIRDEVCYVFGMQEGKRKEVNTPFLVKIDDKNTIQKILFEKYFIESLGDIQFVNDQLYICGTADEDAFFMRIGTDLNIQDSNFFYKKYKERAFDEAKGFLVLNNNLLMLYGNSKSGKLGSRTVDGFARFVDSEGKSLKNKLLYFGGKFDESIETAVIQTDASIMLLGWKNNGTNFGVNKDFYTVHLSDGLLYKIAKEHIPKIREEITVEPEVQTSKGISDMIYFERELSDSLRHWKEYEWEARLITSKSLSISDIFLKVNGKDVPLKDVVNTEWVDEPGQPIKIKATFDLNIGKNSLQLWTVVHGKKLSSEEVFIRYQPRDKGVLYVLSIGVCDPTGKLVHTGKDARDFAELFQNQEGKLFERVELIVRESYESTVAAAMMQSINHFSTLGVRNNLSEKDVIILFISTHGVQGDNGDFYLTASNYKRNNEFTRLSFTKHILDVLEPLPCNKFIFVDACHSGSVKDELKGRKDVAGDFSGAFTKLITSTKSIRVMASCGAEEYSYEDDKWENGAFTQGMIEILSDEGVCKQLDKSNDNALSLSEIYPTLQKNVQQMVRTQRKESQTPFLPKKLMTDDVPFFAF